MSDWLFVLLPIAIGVAGAYVLLTLSSWVEDQAYPRRVGGERTLARYVADQWRHAFTLLGRLW